MFNCVREPKPSPLGVNSPDSKPKTSSSWTPWPTVYAETLGDKADEQTLVDLYTPLVEAGRKTVEQVPEKIKNAVQGRLSAKE
jgi:hypothetical protein